MKKTLKYLLLVLICLTFSLNGVKAKSYLSGLFQADEKVKVDKKIDGTAFIAGNEVTINETIDGIGFIAGNTVKINSIEDYLFVAGNEIVLTKDVNKDLFLAGSNVELKNVNLKRDAYIASDTVDLNGTVGRNLYLYGTKVELTGTYNGNVTVYASEIVLKDNASIKGTLKYNDTAKVTGLSKSTKTKTYKTTTTVSYKDYLLGFVSSYIHLLILGVVLVFAFESRFKKIKNKTKDIKSREAILTCGKGFLILIGVPIIAMMLLFSGLFVSVGVIGGLIYGILVYISSIITSYVVAYKLDEKYFKKNMNTYLLVMIGLLIIKVLSIVPIIGGLVSLVSLLFGLGIAGNMIIELKK